MTHSTSSDVIALGPKQSVRVAVDPIHIVYGPMGDKIIDHDKCVLGEEREALVGIYRAGPTTRQVPSIHVGAEMLLSQCRELALSYASRSDERQAEVARAQNCTIHGGQEWERDATAVPPKAFPGCPDRGDQFARQSAVQAIGIGRAAAPGQQTLIGRRVLAS